LDFLLFLLIKNLATADVETTNYSAHAEGANPVPRANRIAQSALKAIPEGFSTYFFYLFYNLFEGGDCFQCLY
jgi:hypothetical protein